MWVAGQFLLWRRSSGLEGGKRAEDYTKPVVEGGNTSEEAILSAGLPAVLSAVATSDSDGRERTGSGRID